MSGESPQFDGSDFSRYALHLPIKPDLLFEAVFVYRNSRHFSRPRWSAFTKDMETLILAGERTTDMHSTIIISRDSTRIDRKTHDYMGCLKTINFREFVSFSWHPQVDDSQREMLLLKRADVFEDSLRMSVDSVGIPRLGQQILLQSKKYDDLDFQNMLMIKVTESILDSNGHVGTCEGQVCFEMKPIATDEFALTIAHPLSFFQGFAIATARLL
jgi:hypothetical protein